MVETCAEKLRGMIPYPCCGKEKAMVFDSAHGQASYKCPKCGRFATFDFDSMTAMPGEAKKGATHRFKISERCID